MSNHCEYTNSDSNQIQTTVCGPKIDMWPRIMLLIKIHNFYPISLRLGQNDHIMRWSFDTKLNIQNCAWSRSEDSKMYLAWIEIAVQRHFSSTVYILIIYIQYKMKI